MLNNVAALFGGGAPAAVGDYESIQTFTVGSGGASSITFDLTGVSGYKHLQLRWLARDNFASDGSDAAIRFNSDSGSNYSWHQLLGDGSTPQAYASTNQTSARAGAVAGSTAGSNVFAATILDILDYANTTTYKTIRNLAGYDKNGAGGIALNSASWRSTSAITNINIAPRVGTSFSEYSSFALYGIKG